MVVAAAVVVVGSSWVGAPSFCDGVVGASGAPTADDGDADVPPVSSCACSRGASCGGDPWCESVPSSLIWDSPSLFLVVTLDGGLVVVVFLFERLVLLLLSVDAFCFPCACSTVFLLLVGIVVIDI